MTGRLTIECLCRFGLSFQTILASRHEPQPFFVANYYTVPPSVLNAAPDTGLTIFEDTPEAGLSVEFNYHEDVSHSRTFR